jgi:nitrite reductase/ring-hydroxylating ferredoxin subunit/uncharacterized membrane protein
MASTASTVVARWSRALVAKIDESTALEAIGDKVSSAIQPNVPPGLVRDLLSGTPLGHPAHPIFTDMVIGAWTSAFFLDCVPTAANRRASRFLVGTGLLCALPTVATGLSDVADTAGSSRRIGMAHAITNLAGSALYFGSWRARRRGHDVRGIAWGMAGTTVVTVGAYLGGHLSFRRGIGVDNTVFDHTPHTVTVAHDDVGDEAVIGVDVEGVRVAVARHDGKVRALVARCSHRGGPLDEGPIVGDCLECPWHGSRFSLGDGAVTRGPAVAPQPVVEVVVQTYPPTSATPAPEDVVTPLRA